MASTLSVSEQIRQLNDARKLVLGDVKYYPSVVKGILPIIGPSAPVDLRRWGTEFLAEAFSTPALPSGEKETMQPYVLATLQSLVDDEREDAHVLRSVIRTAASIYPLALRWIINNGYDTVTWDKMMAIKQRILYIWDNAVPSVRICCIKFVQRVILAQSVAGTTDLRYGGTLDISLDKVPINHQILDMRSLEAEAMGLLDRMLGILQDSSDALLVDATLNCLSVMVRTRPSMSGRILNALLSFNPLQAATSPLTPKSRVMVRSMEKTLRLLLIHLSKRDAHNGLISRIHQHVERTMRAAAELFDDVSKKRSLGAHQSNGVDAKRQRTIGPHVPIQPLGPGPHTLGDVFTLISNPDLKNFDISQLPHSVVAKVSVIALAGLDKDVLTKAVDGVRGRLDEVANAPAPELNPNTAPLGVDDDDDDYEPDFYPAEDTEQILNKLDGASPKVPEDTGGLALVSFSLGQPVELTVETALSAGSGTITRVLESIKSLAEPAARKEKAGFNRLAASSGGREGWMSILTRLATRASVGLEEQEVKDEMGRHEQTPLLSNVIREVMYDFVMEDFRKRIDVAVSWLCEEWYNDQIRRRTGDEQVGNYEKCALRLLDGFLPYLNPQDKVLTRFLGEAPDLNRTMLSRVKDMCRDPSVTQLALTSLLYLAMMRPPAREIALDTVQDIWTDFEDARPMASKYLVKYRPGFLDEAAAAAATA
ncbi:hypothetical protein CDD81_2965 [Ophiocordyceps australis]|uniref:Symplekin/Pta1 N-terminal domain-containing protein n=1 Tax=Ophiocordyceps australis TaxID=1399860 RepID=A0A2C5YHK8_9HYPO|nr:hypothetical protein CDD81_2965 [Ophiocordyceps australis]